MQKICSILWKIVKILNLKIKWIGLVLLISFTGSIISMLIPQIDRYVIDIIIPNKNISMLMFCALVYITVLISQSALKYFGDLTNLKFTQLLERQGQITVFRKIIYMKTNRIEKEKIGNLMTTMSRDINRYIQFMKSTIIGFITNMFTYISVIIFIFSSNWIAGVAAVCLTPLFAVSFFFNSSKLIKYGKDLADIKGKINSFIQEKISGQSHIKNFHTEEYEISTLNDLYKKANLLELKEFTSRMVPVMSSMLISGLISSVIYIGGSYLIIIDKLTVGEMIAIASWIVMTGRPINNIASTILNFNATLGSIERSNSILDAETEENFLCESKLPVRDTNLNNDDIILTNVSFSYDNENSKNYVLKDINLIIPKGKVTAIVGESGSGKSTLIKLIARMYDNYTGIISLGKTDYKNIDLGYFRNKIGIISQNIVIWNDTIKNNLLYAFKSRNDNIVIDESQLIEAIKMSGLANKVAYLQEGIESYTGKNGELFSGGERQRLAITQLILKNPDIIIFDEATSGIDARLENEILNNLFTSFKGKTIIIVTHRLTSVTNVDYIVLLKEGYIYSAGSHKELLENSIEYRSLYDNMVKMDQ